MGIKDLIKAIRKRNGSIIKSFADKFHVSFFTANRWENGHVMPNQLAIVPFIEL